METGEELWRHKHAEDTGGDSSYTEAYDGVVIADAGMAEPSMSGGGARIIGMNASSGLLLWVFRPQIFVWNFMALFPGDGTFLFMDIVGGMGRHWIHNGTQVYFAPGPPEAKLGLSFSDGGMSIGPGGSIAYTCSSFGGGQANTKGVTRALRVSDGHVIWTRELPQPCNSWPAIGRLPHHDKDSVVVLPGPFSLPNPSGTLPRFIPEVVKLGLYLLSLWLAERDLQQYLWLNPTLHSAVWVLDALTGEVEWTYDIEPYRQVSCSKGHEEGAVVQTLFGNGRHELTGPWSAPTISGDGTIYAGNHNGFLYAIRDSNGDLRIDPATEVSARAT
eukprot:CAMPEP_0168483802 /NCGR_PEP_ID=MMETSP0228-20121227/65766_1 /TAXON_ID=133427 /ORGANISM="Protoceratium reticulatum, Strain CCCM 535 (=CCMP 1889)" /LENGTH=330 /DNA_ID=CAMNT_0008500315 /DNA_START=105 /DNA_END=1094 /DNA_ORIENTATION=-